MYNEHGSSREIKAFYRYIERHDWVARRRWFESHREKGVSSLIGPSRHAHNSLEVGCGTGLLTRHLNNAVGIDLNLWAIKKAKERCPESFFVVADGEHLPFKDQTFSLVLSADVLEHLPDAEQAVREIWRVLSDKGRLIGSVPHSNLLWKECVRKQLTPLKRLEPLHNTYTVRRLSNLLSIFPDKRLIPDILHIEIFFEAQKARDTIVIRDWNRFWISQGSVRRAFRYFFNAVFAAFVLSRIPRRRPLVLDVGVGSGSCAKAFQNHGYQVIGVDFSLMALMRAAQGHLPLLLCDAAALPFRDNTFGLCYAQGLIEHLKSPTKVIEEMQRTSYVVAVSVPREFSPFDLLRRLFEWLGKSWLWPDELYFNKGDLERLLGSVLPKFRIHSFFGLDLIAIGERSP